MSLEFHPVYDDYSGKTLLIKAETLEQALSMSETIDFFDFEPRIIYCSEEVLCELKSFSLKGSNLMFVHDLKTFALQKVSQKYHKFHLTFLLNPDQ